LRIVFEIRCIDAFVGCGFAECSKHCCIVDRRCVGRNRRRVGGRCIGGLTVGTTTRTENKSRDYGRGHHGPLESMTKHFSSLPLHKRQSNEGTYY
jgi:hypothetical protein